MKQELFSGRESCTKRQNGVCYGNYKIFADRSGASDVPFRRKVL